jgi:hypothetical protein
MAYQSCNRLRNIWGEHGSCGGWPAVPANNVNQTDHAQHTDRLWLDAILGFRCLQNYRRRAVAESGFLIALHSPYADVETGLHDCLPEKSYGSSLLWHQQFLLRSPVC